MLLFLDVISPIPEFFAIEDNKVIFQRKIVKNESQKISDNIFETFIKINKELNLLRNIKKISMTIGPGSYTSLRVGAAFMAGLRISKEIPFLSLTVTDIFKYKLKCHKELGAAIFISSSNNQQFFCTMKDNYKIEYKKIELNKYFSIKNINTIFYNNKKYQTKEQDILQYKFSFIDALLFNIDNLKFTKDNIIKPIYISNNKILN
tara:strand:+ start:702 stop:1316 length:615 start_codon:yes stop_codon:yes gene_type:complete